MLQRRELKVSDKFKQWEGVRQRQVTEAYVCQGLQVGGREFPAQPTAPGGEDRARGYGAGQSEGWKRMMSWSIGGRIG